MKKFFRVIVRIVLAVDILMLITTIITLPAQLKEGTSFPAIAALVLLFGGILAGCIRLLKVLKPKEPQRRAPEPLPGYDRREARDIDSYYREQSAPKAEEKIPEERKPAPVPKQGETPGMDAYYAAKFAPKPGADQAASRYESTQAGNIETYYKEHYAPKPEEKASEPVTEPASAPAPKQEPTPGIDEYYAEKFARKPKEKKPEAMRREEKTREPEPEPVQEPEPPKYGKLSLDEMKEKILGACLDFGADEERVLELERTVLTSRPVTGEGYVFSFDEKKSVWKLSRMEEGAWWENFQDADPQGFCFRFLEAFVSGIEPSYQTVDKDRKKAEAFMRKTWKDYHGTEAWWEELGCMRNEGWSVLREIETWDPLTEPDGTMRKTLAEQMSFSMMKSEYSYKCLYRGKWYPVRWLEGRPCILTEEQLDASSERQEHDYYITYPALEELEDLVKGELAAEYKGDFYKVGRLCYPGSIELMADQSQSSKAHDLGFIFEFKEPTYKNVSITELDSLRIWQRSILDGVRNGVKYSFTEQLTPPAVYEYPPKPELTVIRSVARTDKPWHGDVVETEQIDIARDEARNYYIREHRVQVDIGHNGRPFLWTEDACTPVFDPESVNGENWQEYRKRHKANRIILFSEYRDL